MPQKKSKSRKKKQTKLQKFVSQLRSKQSLVLGTVFVLVFAAIGVWQLTGTHATTSSLSLKACHQRGRPYSNNACQNGCLSGAGTYITSARVYNYCSHAVSTSIGATTCTDHGRVHIEEGCLRGWNQVTDANAIQCINSAATYYISSIDYCKVPGTSTSTPAPTTSGWTWPLPQTHRVTTGWGVSTSKGIHKGIDIGLSGGGSLGAKVVAAHSGYVTQSYNSGSCGYFLLIKASGTAYWEGYQHLDPNSILVRNGQSVSAGQAIAKVGTAGGSTCGTAGFYHLHFSVEKTNNISFYSSPLSQSINPLNVLP